MGIAEFAVHTDIVTGLGSLSCLAHQMDRHDARRVAVAVDAALAENRLLDFVLSHAPDMTLAAVTSFAPNPDVASVESAVAEAKDGGADSVLAVGGGSALGASKAMAILMTNSGSIFDYEGSDRVMTAPAPTIAVPTTAGSGSEVSNALVLHEASRPQELVVRGRNCAPRAAILDARVLRSLPERPLLYAAFDALSHCMEALWARGRSSFTTQLALHSAHRILDLVPQAVAGVRDGRNVAGDNDEVLQELLECSCAANMACGNSGLGLIHALSSSIEVDLPHGLQNGVLLPHVARFNAEVLPPQARPLLRRIDELYNEIGFEPSFAAVTTQAVPGRAMIQVTTDHPFRANNGRPARDHELETLLRAAGAVV